MGIGGNNLSPQLTWKKVTKAQSYAVTIIDNEAANIIGMPFIHWLVANIQTNSLAQGASESVTTILQGRNSLSSSLLVALGKDSNNLAGQGYIGPAPPDVAHNYEVTIYALDVKTLTNKGLINKDFHLGDLKRAMQNHIIAKGTKTFLANTRGNLSGIYHEFYKNPTNVLNIDIKTTSLDGEQYLKAQFVHSATSQSPNLSWNEIKGAQFYSLTMIDDEATNVTGGLPFIHWLATNIEIQTLENNATATIADKIIQGDSSATKEFIFKGANAPIIPKGFLVDKANRYFGPQPPDQDHVYTLKIFAHAKKLSLKQGFKLGDLSRALHGKVIGEGEISLKVKVLSST